MTGDTTTILRDSVVTAEDRLRRAPRSKLREGSGGSGVARAAQRHRARPGRRTRSAARSTRPGRPRSSTSSPAAPSPTSTPATAATAAARVLEPAPRRLAALSLGAGIQSRRSALRRRGRATTARCAGSPTIDAGAADAHTSAADPDGRARTVPDIGAFECCAPRTRVPGRDDRDQRRPPATRPAAPTAGPAARPRRSRRPCSARPSSSRPARARCSSAAPATSRFRTLGDATLLPSGTVVDARRGRIRLTTALDEAGKFQTGRFWGARFEIRQGHKAQGMTSLTLRGGDFGALPGPRERPRARERRGAREPDDAPGGAHASGRATAAGASAPTATTASPPHAAPPGSRATAATARSPACARAPSRSRTGAPGRTVVVRAGGAYLAKR